MKSKSESRAELQIRSAYLIRIKMEITNEIPDVGAPVLYQYSYANQEKTCQKWLTPLK